MPMSKRAGLSLFVGGAGLVVAGLILLRRERGGLGRSNMRLSTKNVPAAPVVDTTYGAGMKVEHRRSANMSIEQRVRSIQELTWKSVGLPQMRKLALQITRNCPERDKKCEAEAVYKYVKSRVRYTGDVATLKHGADGPNEPVDMYQRADRTLEFGGGDCDDHSVLNATLLTLNGIESRLRVTAETKGSDWGHIYAVGDVGGKWAALDTTLPGNKRFNYEVPFARSLDFPA